MAYREFTDGYGTRREVWDVVPFKRDFAGEIMDRFPDLRLVDYGFVYHRDPQFPQDDFTWFLMEKR
jgi:hypothetical protein